MRQPPWMIQPRPSGDAGRYLVTPKTAMRAEGRGVNLSQALSLYRPVAGGRMCGSLSGWTRSRPPTAVSATVTRRASRQPRAPTRRSCPTALATLSWATGPGATGPARDQHPKPRRPDLGSDQKPFNARHRRTRLSAEISHTMLRCQLVIDLEKCTGCQACTTAYGMENARPPNENRQDALFGIEGEYRSARIQWLPRPCMDCEPPPVVQQSLLFRMEIRKPARSSFMVAGFSRKTGARLYRHALAKPRRALVRKERIETGKWRFARSEVVFGHRKLPTSGRLTPVSARSAFRLTGRALSRSIGAHGGQMAPEPESSAFDALS